MRLPRQTTSPLRLRRMMRPGGRWVTRSQRMDVGSGRHLSKFTALEGQRRAENDLPRSAKSNSRFCRQNAPDATEKGRYLSVDDRVHVCFQRHPVDELANPQVENRRVKTPHHLIFQNSDWKLGNRRTAVFSSDLDDHLLKDAFA